MSEKTKPLSDESFGGLSEKGFRNGASGHSDRVCRYGERRKRAVGILQYLRSLESSRQDIQRAQADLAQCANWLLFRNYYTVDEIRLAAAHTCKRHLLCPFCAARRAAKQVERYGQRFAEIARQRPSLKPVMLTLTVRNGDDLEERMDHLRASFRRLQDRRRDWLKKGRGYTEFSKVAGAVFSYEVTNKGKGWHPHLHAVLLLEDWIDRDALVAEWQSITGDSHVLDIRRLAKGTRDLLDAQGNIAPAIAEAFCEVFKYALKFSDLDYGNTLHAWETLRGKRLQGSFGLFRGVQVPDSLLDDPLADLPYLEMVYRFNGQTYDLTATRKSEDCDEYPRGSEPHAEGDSGPGDREAVSVDRGRPGGQQVTGIVPESCCSGDRADSGTPGVRRPGEWTLQTALTQQPLTGHLPW